MLTLRYARVCVSAVQQHPADAAAADERGGRQVTGRLVPRARRRHPLQAARKLRHRGGHDQVPRHVLRVHEHRAQTGAHPLQQVRQQVLPAEGREEHYLMLTLLLGICV